MELDSDTNKIEVALIEPTTAGQHIYICDRCGTPMVERNCKVICENCGNRFDCSDLTLYFD
jgi:uncharacterized Zn finger protein (UPF0148 family)